jgi:hypothetical protein
MPCCCSHEAVVQCIWRATRVCRHPHIRHPCATTFHLRAVCRDYRHKIQNFPMSMNSVDPLSVFPVSTCVTHHRQLLPTQQEGNENVRQKIFVEQNLELGEYENLATVYSYFLGPDWYLTHLCSNPVLLYF